MFAVWSRYWERCVWGDDANQAPLRRVQIGSEDSAVATCIRQSGRPDEFVETKYVDDTPMPSVRPQEQDGGYVVFGRHWMDLVFAHSVPTRKQIIGTLRTFTSRGEYEPITFCVRSLRKLSYLKITAGELVSKGGARLDAPEVGLVRSVPRLWRGDGPLYKDGPIGVMNMPMYSEEAQPIDVDAGRTVQYCLTVAVSAEAPAGTYEGDIEVSHRGRKRIHAPALSRSTAHHVARSNNHAGVLGLRSP